MAYIHLNPSTKGCQHISPCPGQKKEDEVTLVKGLLKIVVIIKKRFPYNTPRLLC